MIWEPSNQQGNCDYSSERFWKKFTIISKACLCPKHSTSNNAHNFKNEVAQRCLQDSRGSNVTGRKLPCQTEFMSWQQTKNYHFPLNFWRPDIFWWGNFSYRWQSQPPRLQHMWRENPPEVWQCWRDSPELNVWCALRKSEVKTVVYSWKTHSLDELKVTIKYTIHEISEQQLKNVIIK